ncbi:hypothetical protein ScPMuIL_018341 [Solemya velum]
MAGAISRIDVVVALGGIVGVVEVPMERYTVTCLKAGTESKSSGNKVVAPALIAPTELQTNRGVAGNEMIVIGVVDTRDKPIRNRKIKFGEMIKLKAAIRRGLTFGCGFKVVSCDAVGTESQLRYAILRGGCGDGVVIPTTRGFLSDGYFTAVSPPFKMFELVGSDSVAFHCNITICTDKCSGSSCFREFDEAS